MGRFLKSPVIQAPSPILIGWAHPLYKFCCFAVILIFFFKVLLGELGKINCLHCNQQCYCTQLLLSLVKILRAIVFLLYLEFESINFYEL